MKPIEEIKQDIQINQNKLLEEAQKQASLYYDYSEILAQLEAEYKQKKDELEYVSAEINLETRHKASENKIKLTESMVTCIVATNENVARIKNQLVEAGRKVNEGKAIQRALEHKKTMIELIGYKQGRQYNSEPEAYEQRDYGVVDPK